MLSQLDGYTLHEFLEEINICALIASEAESTDLYFDCLPQALYSISSIAHIIGIEFKLSDTLPLLVNVRSITELNEHEVDMIMHALKKIIEGREDEVSLSSTLKILGLNNFNEGVSLLKKLFLVSLYASFVKPLAVHNVESLTEPVPSIASQEVGLAIS